MSPSPDEIIENYEYEYYSYNENSETEEPETVTEPLNNHAPNKRDFGNNANVDETVTYKICVRLVNKSHDTFYHKTMSCVYKVPKFSQRVSQPTFYYCIYIVTVSTEISQEWPLLTLPF